MKIHWKKQVSIYLLSICLLLYLPEIFRFLSTWKQLYVPANGYQAQNLMTPLGFCMLGIILVGLIVLWTGYRRNEPWSWLVMLIITLFAVFPLNVLPILLSNLQNGGFRLSDWFQGVAQGRDLYVVFTLQIAVFVIMLFALVLPIKAFFLKSS